MKEPCVKDLKRVLACQNDPLMVKTMKLQKKIQCQNMEEPQLYGSILVLNTMKELNQKCHKPVQ